MENRIKEENIINENESVFLGRLWKKYKDMQDGEEVCPQELVNSFVDEKAKSEEEAADMKDSLMMLLGNNSDTFWGWGHINISRMAFKDMIDELEENGLYTGMTLV